MRMRRIALLAALLAALPAAGHALFLRGGGTAGGGGGTQLALVRTFNNATSGLSPAVAFKMIGQPFTSCPACGTVPAPDLPPGNMPTAALGGTAARIGICERKYDASGDLAWAQILVDASGADIAAGGSKNLVFTSAPGAFGNTTVAVSGESAGTFTLASAALESGFAQRPIEFTGSLGGLTGFSLNTLYYAYYASPTSFTLWTESGTQITPGGSYASGLSIVLDTSSLGDGGWEGLGDTIVAANVSTFSVGGNDMNAGPYTAAFDGGATNTVTVLCTSPVGREVEVAARMVNSGTGTAHCYLTALMDYWETEEPGGAAGPVASLPEVENMQLFKGTGDGCSGAPGEFTADLSWVRNGVTMRSFKAVPITAATAAFMTRPDGDWDWSADDPGFVVTQDYTKVDQTYKTPPYQHGIVYTGTANNDIPTIAISAVDTTTGLFSTATTGTRITINPESATGGGVVAGEPTVPIAVQFSGSVSGLTGLGVCDPTSGPCTANAVYWTCLQNAGKTQFFIFDDEEDAYACTPGAPNGQIIPGGAYSGSGLAAGMAAAPESVGAYQSWAAGATGDRPDLSLFSEWGTAYLLYSNSYAGGSTYLDQAMSRIEAYALGTMPLFVTSTGTGRLPSLLDAAHTPAALGTAKTTSYWNAATVAYSADINGGSGPTGNPSSAHPDSPRGLWETAAADHAAGNPGYVVWLLEGNPLLQRLGVLYGNEGNSQQSLLGERNEHNTQVGSGATYYAVANNSTASKSIRGNAWQIRDEGLAREMARDGSAEEQVFTTELANEAAFLTAYQAWKATIGNNNWAGWGFFTPDDTQSGVIGVMVGPFNSNFMMAYGTLSFGFLAQIEGDLVPSFNTLANNTVWMQEQEFGNPAQFCPFFGDTYNPSTSLADYGAAPPGNNISSINELSVSSEYNFVFAGSTITVYQSNVLQSPFNELKGTSVALKAGDKYRPFSAYSDEAEYATPPSNLTIGQDYAVLSASGSTFELDNGSGSAIAFTPGPGVQQNVTNAAWASNTVTITVAAATGFLANGDQHNIVVMAGMTPSQLNGVFTATPVVGQPTEFTYTVSGSGTPGFAGATEAPLDGGLLVPSVEIGANCPSTGTIHSGAVPAQGSDYIAWISAGLCTQASKQGAPAASTWGTACANALARITGGGADAYAAWAMQGSP